MFHAAAAGDLEWLNLSLKNAAPPLDTDDQGQSVLHVACLHGQLKCVKLLVESGLVQINSSCPRGSRPVHTVLSTQSSPNSSACLEYLLERGADVNVATHLGETPLHIAASKGLLVCTEALVQAGADVCARDNNGRTPLDLARYGCHRGVSRYLKGYIWHANKKQEMLMKKRVQALYQELVDMSKLNDRREKMKRQALIDKKMEEWANKKGLAILQDSSPGVLVSQVPCRCVLPEQRSVETKQSKSKPRLRPGDHGEAWNVSTNPSRRPPASVARPQTIRMGNHEEGPPAEPDLRGVVTLSRSGSGRPQYTTKWEASPRPAPALPLDTLKRYLFPKAFACRITSPRDFQLQNVLDLPQLGFSNAQNSTSPWTEVALHLAEFLEPGHY